MNIVSVMLILLLTLVNGITFAQHDSLPSTVQRVSGQFIKQTEAKVAQYLQRIVSKTEKTLAKLARWEGKIKVLLEKVNPETAIRLFGNGQMTFTSLLEQYRKGQAIAKKYGAVYDEYRDRLNGTMKYLIGQNNKAKDAQQQLDRLDSLVENTEAVQQFIKVRKRQLIEQSIQYIGQSKYLQKINKESYYYIETLRNYKAIFSDGKKVEQLVMGILQKVPGFEAFLQRNSAVAGLFGIGTTTGSGLPNLSGLQTRTDIQNLLQQQFGSGSDMVAFLQGNVQQAQAQLNQLKSNISQIAGGGSNGDLPNFRPNNTKTKTFLQRIEYTANVSFGRINSLTATSTADIALGIGYKLNDKSTVGIGASYKLGMGSLRRIHFSGEGIGLRSFIDWKLKKQFYVSGGYEMNYLPTLANLRVTASLNNVDAWQRSGLIGISKKMKFKSKWTKGGSIQLLYDILHRQQQPEGRAWIFRIGYIIK